MEQKESKSLGSYHLIRRLARGGMSEVYLVLDKRDKQLYALKMVRRQDEEDCQRFQQEVQVLMGLKHPHILPILESASQEDICYYVMPYIATGTLKNRLARGPLSEREAGIILVQITDALHFLHLRGFVHRDVKPSNILLDNKNTAWLSDFGLVRVMAGGRDLTGTGCLIGTPAYMAPELEKAPATFSSDVYSLGIVLYEMLTGQVPFRGVTLLDLYLKHIKEQPLYPSSLNPCISPAVEKVVLHALEKNPANRYASARELAAAYQNALVAKPDAPITDNLPLIRARKRGQKSTLALAALIAVALLALSLVSMNIATRSSALSPSGQPAHMVALSPVDRSPVPPSPTAGQRTPSASPTAGSSPPPGIYPLSPKENGTPVSSPGNKGPHGTPGKHGKSGKSGNENNQGNQNNQGN